MQLHRRMGLLDSHHCYSSGLPGRIFQIYPRRKRYRYSPYKRFPAVYLLTKLRIHHALSREPGGGGNDLIGFMNAIEKLRIYGACGARTLQRDP